MSTRKHPSASLTIRNTYESAYESTCGFADDAASATDATTSASDQTLVDDAAGDDILVDDAVTLVTAHDAPRTKAPRRFLASRLYRDTRGANLVEYIIVVGLVALIAIVGFKTFGQKVKDKIEGQSTSIGSIQQ